MLRASAESILFTSLYEGLEATSLGEHAPVTDASTTKAGAPLAGILNIDGVQILLDCGMSLDMERGGTYLSLLKPHLASIDCVLLSGPDVACCGALPFVMKHLRRGVPVVAPTSLAKVGTHNVLGSFMAKYPNHATYTVQEDAHTTSTYVMTVDDIFSAFRAVKEPYGNRTMIRKWIDRSNLLRRVTTAGGGATAAVVVTTASDFINELDEGEDVNHHHADGTDDPTAHNEEASVVAEPIGNYRVVGAFMWRLAYQSDDVLYCPDVSLAPSVLLRRTTIPSRSTLVLLGCAGFSDDKSTASAHKSFRAAYDECIPNLMRNITDTLRREKDVLLPVTVSGRGVEMMLLVCKLLQEKGIANYRVVVAHYQAKELMARIKTMTELLLDGLVYGDQDPFAAVVCCRSAEEVASVSSPKIVFADGIDLEEGLAAELLVAFMTNGANLVAPVAYTANTSLRASSSADHCRTNAQRLVDEAQAARSTGGAAPVFAWTYKKRTKLNKVELEQYYLAQEARDAQQRAEEAAAAARAAQRLLETAADGPGANWEEDDNDDDGAAFPSNNNATQRAASAAPAPVQSVVSSAAGWPSGLYLPSGCVAPQVRSGAIVFPVVDTNVSLAAHLAASLARRPSADGDAGVSAYGIPLTPSEVQAIRRSAPQRIINDDAPLDLIQAVNDAQLEANVPCKVSVEEATAPLTGHATVFALPSILYEGTIDPIAMRQIVASTFAPTVKRLVPLRCSAADLRALGHFCKAEQHAFRALASTAVGGSSASATDQIAQLVVPPKCGVPVQLAVAVFAFAVDLDPAFAQHMQRQLHPVRETRSTGYWEVGVVRGMMARGEAQEGIGAADASGDRSQQRQRKRERDDVAGAGEPSTYHGPSLLTFADDAHRRQAGATTTTAVAEVDDQQQDVVPLGSVFIGSVELPTVRDFLRQNLHLRADVSRGLLVIDNGSACVRKGQSGNVTLACAVGQTRHLALREAIYAQYQHAL